MTVADLKEELDNYGDHLEVKILIPGLEKDVFRNVLVDSQDTGGEQGIIVVLEPDAE